MTTRFNILIIPADDRPVSYDLPTQIAGINKNIKLYVPPQELLGDLTRPAETVKILDWLEKTISENRIDYIIIALDTVAYGGLIPSRRSPESSEEINARLNSFRQILEKSSAKKFAFSSIMRISDNNINEEEKEYWADYGKLIFKYSNLKHKGENYKSIEANIPPHILEDYLQTRQRNFEINKKYLEWKKLGIIDFLLYTKDDTAQYGLNIAEADILVQNAPMHTGFDEVAAMLLARAAVENNIEKIRIYPVFSTSDGGNIIPRYEDKPLCTSVSSHINAIGAVLAVSEQEADIILLMHTPVKAQNDLALEEFVEVDDEQSVDFCIEYIKNSGKPVVLADVKNANGADELLVKKYLDIHTKTENLYGYAGWNTAANTIGSALAMGVMRYIAEKHDGFSAEEFNKVMFTRFFDDYAYQTIIRKMVRVFKINPDLINLTFPWCRYFEAKIDF